MRIDTRGLDKWLVPYLQQIPRHKPVPRNEPIHVLLCIADHFEPGNGGVAPTVAAQRVQTWLNDYPRMLSHLRDSDGRPPRHTFFYPMEQYNETQVSMLERLCRAGFGEIEIHHHHHNDTAENLREKLLQYKQILVEKHGMLSRDWKTEEIFYGFIHGDWALNNSLPDGSCCGVNNETEILRETGCYADFTLPAAPSPAQTRKINSLYYAKDIPGQPKSHDDGIDVTNSPAPEDSLMIIQGPLMLNWTERKFGILPKIENSCVQANQPMTMKRLDLWLRARVQVPHRPDWFFVKLHTHGAPEDNRQALIGDAGAEFHVDLFRRSRENPNFHYHYVSAREMYNLVLAAEAGWKGSVSEALNCRLVWNGHPKRKTSTTDKPRIAAAT